MANAACVIDENEEKLRAAFQRLNVPPDTADQSIKLMKLVNDSGVSLIDAQAAVKFLQAAGSTSPGAALLPAAVLGAAGSLAEYKEAKYTALGANQIALTLNMAKVANMTPGRAGATVVLMAAQKALAVAGIVTEGQQSQCVQAIGKLAVDVGVTALTWESGIGAVLGVTGAMLDAATVRQACM